jgi:hypothetical protein
MEYTMNIQKIAERVAVVNTRRALFGKLGCRLATRRQHRTGEDGGVRNRGASGYADMRLRKPNSPATDNAARSSPFSACFGFSLQVIFGH